MYYNKNMSSFDSSNANDIRSKFPDRVPIIINDPDNVLHLKKYKYIVPSDYTFGQFLAILRRKSELKPDKAVICFINNVVPSQSELLCYLDTAHASSDGFMYITITSESVFG